MPGKKSVSKDSTTTTKKVSDLTSFEDTPEMSSSLELPKKEVSLEAIMENQMEILLKVNSIIDILNSKGADITKAASAPTKKAETTFNRFKHRLVNDDTLLSAILEGDNEEIWPHGEYKTRFKQQKSNITCSDTDKVRLKAASVLWMSCFVAEEKETIKQYLDKVDPQPKTTRTKKPKVSLFTDDEADNEDAKPAPKKAAPKKAAPKKAAPKKAKPKDDDSDEESIPQPKKPITTLDDDSDSHSSEC